MRLTSILAAALATALAGCTCGGNGQNQPPAVTITSPANGDIFQAGEAIALQANATDREDGSLNGVQIVWTSTLSGQLATGATADVSLSQAGTHILTVTATDSKGATGSASVSVTVVAPNAPRVQIVLPLDGATVSAGEQIDLRCAATTFDGQAVPGSSIAWRSALSGDLGTGANLRVVLSTAGSDIVKCTAIDPVYGVSGAAAVHVAVNVAPGPTLRITRPSRDVVYLSRALPAGTNFSAANAQCNGTATAFDAPGGTGNADSSIEWTVVPGPAGPIATGPSATYSFPADGDYVVTATVHDSRGNAATDSFLVHVVPNVPPYCAMAQPNRDGAWIQSDQPYILAGACTDPETGNPVTPVTWTIEGQPTALGQGSPLIYTVPSALDGDQVLSLCATDPADAALVGCLNRPVHLFTNTPPTACAILTPANGQVVVIPGEVVVLRGAAADAEDSQASLTYVWQASADGFLALGANTSTRNLTATGSQEITLTVMDPWGASCSAIASIRVNDLPAAAIADVRQGAAPGTDCLAVSCTSGVEVAALGTASDPDGVATLAWTDSIAGAFGATASATLPVASAVAGKHTLLFAATDSLGAPARDVREILLLPVGQSTLMSPLAGTTRARAMALWPNGDLNWVDGNTASLYRYNGGVQAPAALSGAGLSIAVEDSGSGAIAFAGLSGSGADKLAGTTLTNYQRGLLDQGGNMVNAVALSLSHDALALGTDNGLVITRASDPNLGGANVQGRRLLDGMVVRALAVDPTSTSTALRLYAATDAGLAQIDIPVAAPFDPAGAAMTVKQHLTPEIRSDAVFSVAVAPDGRVFAGTDRGFSQLGGGGPMLRSAPWSFPDEQIEALAYEARTIGGAPHELVWAGTRNGLVRYDLGTHIPTRFDTGDGLPSAQVLSLAVAPDGTKYVGTATGIATYAGD